MTIMLFQADPAINWTQFGVAGGVIFVVFIFLVFILKIVPGLAATWERVRLAEIGVRAKEADARTAQATSFSLLSEVLNNAAVKQHQETEGIRIMQRVASDSSERMEELVNQLIESVGDISQRLAHVERQLTPGKPHGTKA